MPALYDEVWAARIQWERARLALENLGIMESPPELGRAEPEVTHAPQESEQVPDPDPLPLIEGAGGQLTLF